MAAMRAEQIVNSDPFRCYLGRRVLRQAQPHVVAGCEVHGRNLLFRLRRQDSTGENLVTLLELLELLERQGT
jgi:hypothetical protein